MLRCKSKIWKKGLRVKHEWVCILLQNNLKVIDESHLSRFQTSSVLNLSTEAAAINNAGIGIYRVLFPATRKWQCKGGYYLYSSLLKLESEPSHVKL